VLPLFEQPRAGQLWTHEFTDTRWIPGVRMVRQRLKRGERLYRNGDRVRSLFVVHVGALKTQMVRRDGRERVTGFKLAGDLVGIDSLGLARYWADSIALQDCSVFVIPRRDVFEAANRDPNLLWRLSAHISQEMFCEQYAMLMLDLATAAERVTTFLQRYSARLAARGYSASRFILPMPRADIASYLGLRPETLSRVFLQLRQSKVLTIRGGNEVCLHDVGMLGAETERERLSKQ
jgi:CRP/FNR family transcriptional regulator